jgi:uncharacterized protein YbjT (DUF2867 family)
MKVLVTGASGFVGSHAVQAIVAAGHEVRASARSADRVRHALTPLGCADRVEILEADVSHEAQVRAALDGCAAVIHAGATYSFDSRRRREIVVGVPACPRIGVSACRRPGVSAYRRAGVSTSAFASIFMRQSLYIGAFRLLSKGFPYQLTPIRGHADTPIQRVSSSVTRAALRVSP